MCVRACACAKIYDVRKAQFERWAIDSRGKEPVEKCIEDGARQCILHEMKRKESARKYRTTKGAKGGVHMCDGGVSGLGDLRGTSEKRHCLVSRK